MNKGRKRQNTMQKARKLQPLHSVVCISVWMCVTVRDRVCHVCEGAACKGRATRPGFFEETHSLCHIDQTTASHTLTQLTLLFCLRSHRRKYGMEVKWGDCYRLYIKHCFHFYFHEQFIVLRKTELEDWYHSFQCCKHEAIEEWQLWLGILHFG